MGRQQLTVGGCQVAGDKIYCRIIKLDMSQVEITVRYAILNKSQDWFGSMENYVKVKANNGTGQTTEFKTKIVKGDKKKPITWDETFTFTARPGNGAILEFIVMDEDVTSDDTCGKGFFRLDTCGVFNYGGSQNYNIRLLEDSKKEVEAGNLHITTRLR